MSRFRTQVKIDFPNDMKKELLNSSFPDDAGKLLITEAKALIAQGLSPVKGVGKFAPYKDPDKYPGDRKPAKPVNLALSGEYLRHLTYRKVGANLELGILPSAPNKIKKMYDTHNEGTHPHVAQRKHIPSGEGEEFVASIMKKLKDLYSLKVLDIIKKSNSR